MIGDERNLNQYKQIGNHHVPLSNLIYTFPKMDIFNTWSREEQEENLTNALTTNNKEISHIIKPKQGKPIRAFYEITMTEGNTGDARFNIYQLFNRIEIIGAKGAPVKTKYPDELLFDNKLFRSEEELSRDESKDEIDPTSGVPNTVVIAQNTSKTFRIYVKFLPHSVDWRNLKNGLHVKAFLNLFTDIAYAGSSTNVTLNSFYFVYEQHPVMPPPHRMLKFNDVKWCRNVTQETLNVGVNSAIKLSSLRGHMAGLIFFIRASNDKNDAWDTFYQIEDFHLEDKSGDKINKFNLSDSFAKDILNEHIGGHYLGIASRHIYFVPFCNNIQSVLNQEGYTGGRDISDNDKLIITCPTGWVNGQYKVYIFGIEYQHLCIEDGELYSRDAITY